jgi:aspartate-semialdehyde dehydrogenase
MGVTVAVVGATGVVGREFLRVLGERKFPADRVLALASARSVGTRLAFGDRELVVAQARPEAFDGVDIALFSAGAAVSRELGPQAAARGAVVVDNSSAWRMDPDVPLVVPEVNAAAAARRPKGIIANPNCSTIQLVVALAPIHRELAPVRHVVVSTYQAASGKGQAAVEELRAQIAQAARGEPLTAKVFPAPLALNLVMDWKAGTDGYSEEELKMVNETRKILGDPTIAVSPTTVRVPVVTGHSEAVHVQCAEPIRAADVRRVLAAAPGVVVQDDGYAPGRHPQPIACVGRDEVFVGRIRDDVGVPGAVNLWVVSDNLRKGAATNAVQIAEQLVST